MSKSNLMKHIGKIQSFHLKITDKPIPGFVILDLMFWTQISKNIHLTYHKNDLNVTYWDKSAFKVEFEQTSLNEVYLNGLLKISSQNEM